MQKPRMHLVNPMANRFGGSERRTITCWNLLKDNADVTMWSEKPPDALIDQRYPVERICTWRGHFPRGGTIVFFGVYFHIGHWIKISGAKRIVLIYNTDSPSDLPKRLRRISWSGAKIDVVSSSHGLSAQLGANMPVLESPIELAPFLNMHRPCRDVFTIGRLSRDDNLKHHHEDVQLYLHLAQSGCRLRIMGGTCLAKALANIPNVELLEEGAESTATFLRSLDCFVYRTSDSWYEAFGRVIFEAMASGLPVVCAKRGGYASYLQHGVDSLMFRNTPEAFRHLLRLRDDISLRVRLGAAAITKAREVVGDGLAARTNAFLIGDDGTYGGDIDAHNDNARDQL
jgi:glycosyltransferase involved in cell wall biosynthesis